MSGASVLVVDDMPEIRMIVRRSLANKDLQVFEAASGQAALESIRHNPSIQLLLLDIMLPDMSGYDVMQALLEEKDRRGMKVCFISGKKDKDAVLKAIDSGGDDYIIKPIFPENLRSKVGMLLKRVDLIEGYSHIKCRLDAQILYQTITPDIQIRGLDELSVLLSSSARVDDEYQMELYSERLNEIIKYQGNLTLKVNKCKREAPGKYLLRCRFVGLPENVAKEIRSVAIRGQFLT